MPTSTGRAHGGRPTVFGRKSAVSTGHYLASEIAVHVLRSGGNAFDAAVAAGIALQVAKPHQNGFGGEAPTLLWSSDEGKAYALSGHGAAPRAATLQKFRDLAIDTIPGDGFLPAVVPPAFGSYAFLLKRFGTMTVPELLEPALELATDGFAMADGLKDVIAANAERFKRDWPRNSLSSSACHLLNISESSLISSATRLTMSSPPALNRGTPPSASRCGPLPVRNHSALKPLRTASCTSAARSCKRAFPALMPHVRRNLCHNRMLWHQVAVKPL